MGYRVPEVARPAVSVRNTPEWTKEVHSAVMGTAWDVSGLVGMISLKRFCQGCDRSGPVRSEPT
jgi:hypothetical protein